MFRASFLLLALLSVSEGSKLNLPRVLLPIFKTFSTNYTLEVTGVGCYKWSSSRLDIVSVKMIGEDVDKGCSLRAVVSTVSHEPGHNMAIVLAEEVSNGQVFRADVIVDTISTLRVLTTTRELYMEEPPEMFEVRAYDTEGNQFTTLEGVEFQWSLSGGRTVSHVLRFMSFRESTYETPPTIEAFDSQGRQGHIVLLEGIRTGVTKVSVKLPHPEYRHVPQIEVSLTVIANLIIDPSDAHILVGDSINFRILQVRQGRLVEVNLASNQQYTLVPEDSLIVEVSRGRKVKGLGLGRTKLTLRDSNAEEQDALPAASVTVVEPDYITLSIEPYNNWALLTRQSAAITTQVFDSENHRVQLGDNAKVVMTVDDGVFLLEGGTSNGSVGWGHAAASPGSSEVSSVLYSTSSSQRPLLKTSATLHVFMPLSLRPALIVFPFQRNIKSSLELVAKGGDGVYTWDTEDHSVAAVSQSGVLSPRSEGETSVTVSLTRNHHLKASSTVLVLPPALIEIVEGVHEAQVGSLVYLDVALYGIKDGERVPFTDCKMVKFLVRVEETFKEEEVDRARVPVAPSCAVVALRALAESKAKVSVSLASGGVPPAETTVAAFRALVPLHPGHGMVLLTVGSTRQVVFQGGPRQWFSKVSAVHSADNHIMTAFALPDRNDHYVFVVTCHKLGETSFKVTASTSPYPPIEPVSSTASVTVRCAEPASIELTVNSLPDCPVAVALSYGRVHRIEIVLRDKDGLTFDNATSLSYKWTGVLPMDDHDVIGLAEEGAPDFSLPAGHFKIVTTEDITGFYQIKLSSSGYRRGLFSNSLHTHAEGVITLRLVEPVTAEPMPVTLINQVSSRVSVKLVGGSGHFSVSPSEDVVRLLFNASSSSIELLPSYEGQTTLTVHDLCIPSPLSIPVQVVNIGSLRVEVANKVERGKKTTARVLLFDRTENPLFGDPSLLRLEALPSGLVIIEKHPSHSDLSFHVTGVQLGTVSIVASWANISSPAAHLKVFNAMRLSPRNLTLAVGSEFQLKIEGGPGSDLLFTIADPNIASVSSSGLINALHVGDTWVTVVAGGGDSSSKDSVGVTVVHLTGVRISAPTTTLAVGAPVPLVAVPLPSTLTPLVLGSIMPSLTFAWSLSLPGVAQLHDRFSNAHLQMRGEDRLSMELWGVKAGRTQVQLLVMGVATHLHTSLEVEVVDTLAFTAPPCPPPSILVAPNTRFNLHTNMEEVAFGPAVSLLDGGWGGKVSGNGEVTEVAPPALLLTVSRQGEVETRASTGHALILATTKYSHKQSTHLPIEVKRVHYMMLRVVSTLPAQEEMSSLPQGLDLMLNVSYHDTLGQPFYAAPASLHAHLNRHDRIHLRSGPTNNSLVLSLESAGSSVLHVFDPISPASHDFIKLPVDSHIYPIRSEMSPGEVMCLRSRAEGDGGEWTSDSDSVAVERNGMVRAIKPGPATLTYRLEQHSTRVVATTTITVLPFSSISFVRIGDVSLSNSVEGMKYLFSVSLSRGRDSPPQAPCHPDTPDIHTFPFTCEMRFNSLSITHPLSSIFSISPVFDKLSGTFACCAEVVSRGSANVSMIESNVTLRVTYRDRYDSVVAVFHPAVHVTVPHLRLIPPSAVVYLTIVATPHIASHILVEASDKTVLNVGVREGKSGHVFSWSVRLLSDAWYQPERQRDLAVYVISHLTNQRIKVPVLTLASGNAEMGYIRVQDSSWSLLNIMDFTPSAMTTMFLTVCFMFISLLLSNYCYTKWHRPPGTTMSPSGRDVSHSMLQEVALGRRQSPSSLLTPRRPVYGTPPGSPNISPRLRKLYQ